MPSLFIGGLFVCAKTFLNRKMEMYCYIDDLLSHIMQILSHFLVFCLPFNKH